MNGTKPYGAMTVVEYIQGERDTLLSLGIPAAVLFRNAEMPAGIWRVDLAESLKHLVICSRFGFHTKSGVI